MRYIYIYITTNQMNINTNNLFQQYTNILFIYHHTNKKLMDE